MSETAGGRCTIFPILASSNGLYLYLSEWNECFIAIVSEDPSMGEGDFDVVDAEIVEHRRHAIDWFWRTHGNVVSESESSPRQDVFE
jgi:hypothetical protein